MIPTILFLLRVLSALLLLGFLGLMTWLIYQDMRTTIAVLSTQEQSYGHLRVIATEPGAPVKDTCYPLLSITSMGRSTTSTIVLDNHYVSNQHALITRQGKQWWLEDLGSRNGTYLNDVPLTEATVVSVGDIITIGGTKFKIEL